MIDIHAKLIYYLYLVGKATNGILAWENTEMIDLFHELYCLGCFTHKETIDACLKALGKQ